MKIHNRVALGLLLGVVAGVVLGEKAAVVEPLGTLFVKAIRMVVVPLVASSLIMAIAGLPGRAALGRMGLKAFGFILCSLVASLLIGIATGVVFQPGRHLSREARASLLQGREPPPVLDPEARPSLVDTFLSIVPDNPFRAAVDGNVLQILLVSVLLGLAASALPVEKNKPLVELATSIAEVLFKLTGWILELAPFGVFGLMAAVVGRSGLSVLWTLASYVLVVLGALLALVLVVYLPVIVLVAKKSPARFVEAARPPFLVAFATCSTAAALPVSLQTMSRELGLSSRVTSFVLPLGAAIGRDGSAIYQVLSVLFIAQVYGASLGSAALSTLVVTAMLSSLAVAPVPAASFVNLTILLTAMGLPLEGAALVLGVERPLDMARSSVNLLGHFANASFVDASEGHPRGLELKF